MFEQRILRAAEALILFCVGEALYDFWMGSPPPMQTAQIKIVGLTISWLIVSLIFAVMYSHATRKLFFGTS
jgi:hypothetical protein